MELNNNNNNTNNVENINSFKEFTPTPSKPSRKFRKKYIFLGILGFAALVVGALYVYIN